MRSSWNAVAPAQAEGQRAEEEAACAAPTRTVPALGQAWAHLATWLRSLFASCPKWAGSGETGLAPRGGGLCRA
eukprot:15003030-Alexandrium_andersonii.AAC.1